MRKPDPRKVIYPAAGVIREDSNSTGDPLVIRDGEDHLMSYEIGPKEAAAAKGEPKRRYVVRLFDSMAPRYDLITWVISLGQTSSWRRRALKGLGLGPGSAVLDVGTGTGWAARHLKKLYPDSMVQGMDPSLQMLEEAKRLDPAGIYFHGDVVSIPRHDASFDLVTTVFTTRNFQDLDAALSEMVRVLRDGGRLLVLDTFPPQGSMLWKAVNRFWLGRVVPILAAPLGGRESFEYLSESILKHVSPAEMALKLKKLGCRDVELKNYSLGSATRILAVKDR